MSSRLGEILVKDSLITADQLKQALEHQKKNGGRLGTCLVKLGLVSDDDITAVLSRQYGVPSINLKFYEVDPSVSNTCLLYFDFQLWQEGVARYTEIALGDLAARAYTPSRRVQRAPRLQELRGCRRRPAAWRAQTTSARCRLRKLKRVVVYSTGAADALLLDRVRPSWKGDFLSHRHAGRPPPPRQSRLAGDGDLHHPVPAALHRHRRGRPDCRAAR